MAPIVRRPLLSPKQVANTSCAPFSFSKDHRNDALTTAGNELVNPGRVAGRRAIQIAVRQTEKTIRVFRPCPGFRARMTSEDDSHFTEPKEVGTVEESSPLLL